MENQISVNLCTWEEPAGRFRQCYLLMSKGNIHYFQTERAAAKWRSQHCPPEPTRPQALSSNLKLIPIHIRGLATTYALGFRAPGDLKDAELTPANTIPTTPTH